jgi:hypothetical protein
MLCVAFYAQTQDLWVSDGPDGGLRRFSGTRSITDYLIFMAKGMEAYAPSTGGPFIFPIFWGMLHVLIALLVAGYPTSDFHGYALNVFLHAGSRGLWWAAKAVWTVLTVCSFYLLGLVVTLAFALAAGDATIFPASQVSLYVSAIDALAVARHELLLALLVPPASSIALSMLQVLLSFIIKPSLSFLAVMAYCFVSVFIPTPFLIGDYSMLLRNGIALQGGLSSAAMLAIDSISAVALAGLGGRYFQGKDIGGSAD